MKLNKTWEPWIYLYEHLDDVRPSVMMSDLKNDKVERLLSLIWSVIRYSNENGRYDYKCCWLCLCSPSCQKCPLFYYDSTVCTHDGLWGRFHRSACNSDRDMYREEIAKIMLRLYKREEKKFR